MTSTILFPTDFSDEARWALDYLMQAFPQRHYRLLLMHAYHLNVIDPFTHQALIQQMDQEIRDSAHARLQEIKEDLKSKYQFENCEVLLNMGLAVDEILQIAQEMKVDMVVMGTAGASGITQWLIGSNTASVVEKTECPVLAIPYKAAMPAPKNEELPLLIYATDITDLDFFSIIQLGEVRKLFNFRLHLMHVLPEPNYRIRGLLERIAYILEPVFPQINFDIYYHNHALEGIREYLIDKRPDVLAMTTHKRSFIDQLYTRSLTKDIAFSSQTPLLALHKLKH